MNDAPATVERGGQGDLFGRGMLYVLIWSLQLVVATIVSPILTRVLPQAEFGALAAVIALYQLLTIGCLLGLDQALEIQRVEDSDDHRARGLLAAGLVVAFSFSAVAALTAQWWGPLMGFRSYSLTVQSVVWTAAGASVLLVLSLLQAEDKLPKFATVSIMSTVGGLLLGVLALFVLGHPGDRRAAQYTFGGVIAQYAALAIGLWWCRPRWGGLKDRETLRWAFALGLPLVAANIAQFVLSAADRMMIQRMMGPEYVAQYQVAFTVGNVSSLLLAFTSRAWMPRLKSITSDALRWDVIADARDGIYWLLGWVLLGITVSAPFLLRIFAPASYEPGVMTPIVFVVGLGALAVAAAAATSQLLITTRHSRPIAWASAAAAVVKVVATLVGLKVGGLLGAAVATVLALATQAFWQRIAVTRVHGWRRSAPSALVFLTVAVGLSGISTLLPQDMAWNIGRFVFSALCVPPFFYALRALQRGTPPLPGLKQRVDPSLIEAQDGTA